jgi:hypothetical protein
MNLIGFQFTWSSTGTTATVTIPAVMTSADYTVTAGFEDVIGAASILTFPVAGRTTTQFDVEAAGSIDAGTVIGFIVRVR